MRPTPLDTLLAERLQSARGLGWDAREAAAPMPDVRPFLGLLLALGRLTAYGLLRLARG